MNAPVKVIYITGVGRSGSTLLGNVLGQGDQVSNCGELGLLWQRGLLNNEPCGCGKPFGQCEVWQPVVQALQTESLVDEARQMAAALEQIGHTRRFVSYLLFGISANPNVIQRLGLLYPAIQRALDAKVLVDTSKWPAYALLMGQLPALEVLYIHLVRDPRAVAFSYQRRKQRPETGEPMQQMGHVKTGALWLVWNLFIELFALFGRFHGRKVRVHYEDFVQDPEKYTREILAQAGCSVDVIFLEGPALVLQPGHTVSGNPDRFKTGLTEIRMDAAWEKQMPGFSRLKVLLLTWPLALAYGYIGPGKRR